LTATEIALLILLLAGSFAAWWKATFSDEEAGSLLLYLNRLGMEWSKVDN
jgi:hypothetical protein